MLPCFRLEAAWHDFTMNGKIHVSDWKALTPAQHFRVYGARARFILPDLEIPSTNDLYPHFAGTEWLSHRSSAQMGPMSSYTRDRPCSPRAPFWAVGSEMPRGYLGARGARPRLP